MNHVLSDDVGFYPMWLLLHMYKNQVCDRSDNTFLTRVIFFVLSNFSLTGVNDTKIYSTKTLITLILYSYYVTIDFFRVLEASVF